MSQSDQLAKMVREQLSPLLVGLYGQPNVVDVNECDHLVALPGGAAVLVMVRPARIEVAS